MRRIISAVLAFSLVLALAGCEPSARTPEEYCELGIRYLTEGDYEEAVIAFTSALEVEPMNIDALRNRGTALQKLGGEENLQGAREDFQAALDLDDSSPDIWFSLFDVLMDLGETGESKDLLADAYTRFGETAELGRRVDRLTANGLLSDEDLALFGREPPVARHTADFEPVQLSQAETDEIINLVFACYGWDYIADGMDYLQYGAEDSTYDCTEPDAMEHALEFISVSFHDLYEIYFPADDIQTSYKFAAWMDGPTDPLGALPYVDENGSARSYKIFPGENFDWILKNVLNLDPVHPEAPAEYHSKSFMTSFSYYYYDDGNYYVQGPGGVGDTAIWEDHTLVNPVQSQDYLYTTFHVEYQEEKYEEFYNDRAPDPVDIHLLLKHNEVDGRYVWSLCYMNLQPLDDISRFIDL